MQKGRKAKLRVNGRALVLQALSGFESAEDKAWAACKAEKERAYKAKQSDIAKARNKYAERVKAADLTYASVVADARKMLPIGPEPTTALASA